MKIVLKVLLVAAIAALVYMCYQSILTPIKFKEVHDSRERVIVERLISIRDAQIGFKNINGKYAGTFAELQKFLAETKIPFIIKERELSDQNLKDGLTEAKAVKIVQSGNKKEIDKYSLEGFRRDTNWVLAKDTLLRANFDVASINKVPGFEDNSFALDTATLSSPSGYTVPVFECSVPYNVYLGDLDKQELINLKDKTSKLNRFGGLRVGSITEINNNAGNWEF
ncbi:MAG: hypothetical protein LBS80_00580 [Tannerella sp.]|jgi:hypothetical protein|nr:hypothetical protein [Tannerella sp.]